MDMKIVCRQCGNELQADDQFCPYCGYRVEQETVQPGNVVYCVECGAKNDPDGSFCVSCGAKLDVDPHPAAAKVEKTVKAPVIFYNDIVFHKDSDKLSKSSPRFSQSRDADKEAVNDQSSAAQDDDFAGNADWQSQNAPDPSSDDAYDEWIDEDDSDPYDEYDEAPPEEYHRAPAFRYVRILKWACAALICVLLMILFWPYLKKCFVKPENRDATPVTMSGQQSDELDWASSPTVAPAAEPVAVPTMVPTEAPIDLTLLTPTRVPATYTPTPTMAPTDAPINLTLLTPTRVPATHTPVPMVTPTPAPITHVTASRSSYIHARADASTLVIGELKGGEYIRFEGTKTTGADGDVWYKVEHNQKYGWVSSIWTALARQNEVPTGRSFDYSCVIEDNDCTSFFYWDDYYGEFELYEEGGYGDVWNDDEPDIEASVYTTGDVNMRSGPGKGYGILIPIKKDTLVAYLDEYSVDERGVTWYFVSHNGYEGWVSSKYAVLG